MNHQRSTDRPPTTAISLRDVLHAIIAHPLRWVLPLVLCTTLGALYAFLKPATWEATQRCWCATKRSANRPGRADSAPSKK